MKNWRLNTTIKWKRHKDVNALIFKVSNWCKEKLLSDKKLPTMWIDRDYSTCCGEYCWTDNEITIYPNTNETVQDLIDTVIHEWVHFTQDSNELNKYEFAKGVSPTEKEAVQIARIMTRRCWKTITHESI